MLPDVLKTFPKKSYYESAAESIDNRADMYYSFIEDINIHKYGTICLPITVMSQL